MCTQSIKRLYRDLNDLTVAKIIKKLYDIHGLKAVPVSLTDSDGFSFFIKTTSNLLSRYPEFDDSCTEKFVAMLNWREIQSNPNRGGTINILKTLKTKLNSDHQKITKRHLDWLLQAYTDAEEKTAHSKDLAIEFSITKAIHLECKSKHFVWQKENRL